jgi:carboxyl-terminal processing protease
VLSSICVNIVASSLTCEQKNERELYNALKLILSKNLYLQSEQSIPIVTLCSELKYIPAHTILKNYIRKIDEYGDYFTRDEYTAYVKSMAENYAGIGMLLYKQKHSEDILCIPLNDDLEKLGIEYHDKLISVDDKSVLEKNFYTVSGWIRGAKDTKVKIKIQKKSGKQYVVNVKRKSQTFNTVQTINIDGFQALKILFFSEDTPRELKLALSSMNLNIPIIIDLRGNGGGDYMAAINCADIFLEKGSYISSLKTTTKQIDYYAKTNDLTNGKTVVVIQNKFTASAAEVFTAALTQNFRAESLGSKSFGKGVAQKFIPLPNGDKLLLTYAHIVTPNKKNYNNIGLSPTSTLTLKELLFDLKY